MRKAKQPTATEAMVPVLNMTGRTQVHGVYTLPADQYTPIPSSLAERLIADNAGYQTGCQSDTEVRCGGLAYGYRIPARSVAYRNVGTWPSVAVVVPVYNCPDLLSRCIDGLRKTSYAGNVVFVWVDNGSTNDATRALLKDAPGRVLRLDKRMGFAAAVNRGIECADASHYVLFNQDCEVCDAGWLTALMSWMQLRPQCGVAGAKLLYPDGKIQHVGLEFPKGSCGIHRYKRAELSAVDAGDYELVPAVTGAVFALRRSVYEELRGFDTAYVFGNEDTDFCFRAMLHGWEVWYVPGCVVTHIDNGVRKSSARTAAWAQTETTKGEGVFRERWGDVVDRCAEETVRFLLPRYDDSERCRLVMLIANRLVSCGQKTTVHTFEGRTPPTDALFGSGRIDRLQRADTLVATGWETVGVAGPIQAKRAYYLACTEDDNEAASFLGQAAVRRQRAPEDYEIVSLTGSPVTVVGDADTVIDKAEAVVRGASELLGVRYHVSS